MMMMMTMDEKRVSTGVIPVILTEGGQNVNNVN